MFARHLPPSAGLPLVLALDPAAAVELVDLAQVTVASDPEQRPAVGAPAPPEAAPEHEHAVGARFMRDAPLAAGLPPGPFDAVAGNAPPEAVAPLVQLLRPGGRLILAADAAPEPLLAALTAAGLIHCLVETHGPHTLYRGERPPIGAPLERHARLAAALPASLPPSSSLISPAEITQRFVFILVTQTPNKPAWKLSSADRLEWRAATVRHPAAGARALLAFSGLARAVAFMQAAVLAGAIKDVNKVGKFPVEAARAWGLPVLLNPDFDLVRGLDAGLPLPVDPGAAITGEE